LSDFTELSCREFTRVLSSREPVPGGGGASAYVGAIGVSLGSMLGSLTLGRKKYAHVEDKIAALIEEAQALREELLDLVELDAEVFLPLSRAYGLPKDTPQQREEKARILEGCLREGCDVPLKIMERCCRAIELHRGFAAMGTAVAISDVGCGVTFCKAALISASLNVFINTKLMADREYAQQVNRKADRLLEYTKLADEIYHDVVARFR